MDLRSLMKGGKEQLVKSTETWQLSLAGLMTLGTEDDHGEGVDAEEGLDYKGYLRGLLLLENKTNLILRTEDLIELCGFVQIIAFTGWKCPRRCGFEEESLIHLTLIILINS